ncbi:hypothetical protein BN2476_290006 [Paraburkholderia piptadeniae]|uniref:Uncharacterized protein n=1 Tax=Paraburkholderia piptadeniae TaxID=1701573 RepID=A0A1N7S245_9BURK|nr:hypothetical protein BN2476_290006 [Paraburkholderia piptadeniae]
MVTAKLARLKSGVLPTRQTVLFGPLIKRLTHVLPARTNDTFFFAMLKFCSGMHFLFSPLNPRGFTTR